MKEFLNRLLNEDEGQGITEYALMLGLIVFGIWVLVSSTDIGNSIRTLFTNVKNEVDKCNSAGAGCGGGTGGP